MQALGKGKIETSRNVLKVGKKPPSVVIQSTDDFISWAEKSCPQLLRPKAPEPNKTAIKDYLNSGNIIAGVSLEQGEKLTIK